MADLLVPDGDTDRPRAPADRGYIPDRAAAFRDALAQVPLTAADRTVEPATPLQQRQPGIAIAQVPDWVVRSVDQVSYPTRMARRRAFEAAKVVGGWEPDPDVTAPVLARVEDELSRLLDRQFRPGEEPERPEEPKHGPADAGAAPAGQRSRAGTDDLLPGGTRRRRHGRRWIAAVSAAAVLLAAGGAAVLTRTGNSRQDVGVVEVAAVQQVVAVALARDGQLTGVSLLAAGSGTPQQVLVPSRLLLDVPGAGRLPVAQSLAPGPAAPGAAIADALQIRVAGTWVLDSAALATLVDSVGGVTVDVDVDVPQSSAPGAALLVSAGAQQRLDGGQAAAYAQLLVDDEPEASRLARQEQVVTALLAALPDDLARRRAVVVALPGAPTGAVLDAVLAVTGELRQPAGEQTMASTVVPTRDIDTGATVTAYGLDSDAAATLVHTRLPGAELLTPPGGRLRVLVQNGDGAPGLGEAARAQLVAAGLRYVGGGNVDGFGVPETMVLLPDASSQSRAEGLTVTRALGLTESALRISDDNPTVADLVVVLGADFHSG